MTIQEALAALRAVVDQIEVAHSGSINVQLSIHGVPESVLGAMESLGGVRSQGSHSPGVVYDRVSFGDENEHGDIDIDAYGVTRALEDCWLCRKDGADRVDGLHGKPVHGRCVDALAGEQL